jgi:hypothetical protein
MPGAGSKGAFLPRNGGDRLSAWLGFTTLYSNTTTALP